MDASEGSIVARRRAGGVDIVAVQGDLTRQAVDAVVNAANEQLAHGGGVAAALARQGGPTVQRESDAWVAEHGPVEPGEAAVTTAGALPATWIVHVVGPRYRPGQDNAELLGAAVAAALDAAASHGAVSVAMPAISTGIFGYPRADAATVIAATATRWAQAHAGSVCEIRLVGFDAPTAGDFAAALSG